MNVLNLKMLSSVLSACLLFCGFGTKAQEPGKPLLTQGDIAPNFQLKGQDGKIVSQSDFKGRKLLLYFYPKAGTPGCTAQACSIRDAMPELDKLSIAAVGISPDAQEAQAKFAEEQVLAFPLLSDLDHKVAEAYGVWGMKKAGDAKSMGIIRSSFLIDEEGKIVKAWYNVKPADTVPNALEALKKSKN